MRPIPTIVLASDHAGFPLKEKIKSYLKEQGIPSTDVGTLADSPVDYPAIMRAGCKEVLKSSGVGLFFGGSGQGEAMASNKVKGIRAAVCWSEESARLARSHNDANVLCLGARLLDHDLALHIVDIFLSTEFENGRHSARVNDLDTPLSA